MHRKNTAVGTAGPVGASYAVLEKNWKCPGCKTENFARRTNCLRCRAKKPKTQQEGGQVWHEGAALDAAGIDHKWREVIDPKTQMLYYYNLETKETQWNRPAEMGEAPTATGWFGRGRAGVESKLDEKNEEYLKRPAPVQSDGLAKNTAYQEGMESFNIWYGRYTGEHWSSRKNFEPAKSRCKVELHAGYTQADKRKDNDKSYFCLLWVKGLCCKGSKCQYFHRVPTYADCGRLEKDMMHDCFGRERHAAHRDDMQGVGSFNSSSRTLYVGKLLRAPYDKNRGKLKDVLMDNFNEFGEVEHINVIWDKSIAFVRFRFRSHAELAKEAMANQALANDEILDVRWAYDDPNPVAKEAIKRANADAVIAAIKASGHEIQPTKFAQPANYHSGDDPTSTSTSSTMKQLENDKAVNEFYYPNTDAQYQTDKEKAGDDDNDNARNKRQKLS